MKSLTKKVVLGISGGLMLLGIIASAGASSSNNQVLASVNEYEGQHRIVAQVTTDDDSSLTRKVNEYEGQF